MYPVKLYQASGERPGTCHSIVSGNRTARLCLVWQVGDTGNRTARLCLVWQVGDTGNRTARLCLVGPTVGRRYVWLRLEAAPILSVKASASAKSLSGTHFPAARALIETSAPVNFARPKVRPTTIGSTLRPRADGRAGCAVRAPPGPRNRRAPGRVPTRRRSCPGRGFPHPPPGRR